MRIIARAAAITVVGLVACGRGDARRDEEPPPPRPNIASVDASISSSAVDVAVTKPLSETVLAIAATYPDGGGYAWPAPKGTHGTTRDLYAGGERIAVATESGSHCVGLTFEVLWRALEQQPGGVAARGITPARARDLRERWFVPRTRGRGPAEALPRLGLGVAIDDLDDARPGDFVQVWFNNDRGHSMIFGAWVRDEAGAITAMEFWSSQPWTDGIGRSVRAIGDGPRDIDRDAIHIARAVIGPTTLE